MGTIRPFIRNASFDPKAIAAMSAAFETAKTQLAEKNPDVQETLAVRIITLASCGELDPDRLAEAAVRGLTAWRKA
jgi:hypothetical protein